MHIEELQLVIDQLSSFGFIREDRIGIMNSEIENKIVEDVNKQAELDKQAIDDAKNNYSA